MRRFDRERITCIVSRRLRVVMVLLLVMNPAAGFSQKTMPEESPDSATQSVPLRKKPPAKRPEFRKRLSDNEFQKRSAAVIKFLGGLKRLENNEYPAVGTRIVSVSPEGQGQRLGLKVDDVIFRLDDQWLWASLKLTRKRVAQQLHYYRPSTKTRHTIRIEPGLIGISTLDQANWFPEYVYTRSGTRSEKWDGHVLVGIRAAESDPDLAETAWHAAIQAGYQRDFISAAAGAGIALAQGRTAVATEFAYFARQSKPEDEELVHPVLLYRVAMADCEWADALNLVQDIPEAFQLSTAVLEQMISRHRQLPLAQQTMPAPSDLASTMFRDNLMPRLLGVSSDAIVRERPILERGDPLQVKAFTARYKLLEFDMPEPVDGIDFSMDFTLKPTDSDTSEFYKQLEVGLFDRDAERFASGNFLVISLHEDSVVEISHNNGGTTFAVKNVAIRIDGSQKHTIRIVRVGGYGEIFLDGKRILYTPVDAEARNLALNLKVVGTTLQIGSYKVDELIKLVD